MSDADELIDKKQIEVCQDGPYIVTGSIPLVSKIQLVSEYGEPLAWRKNGEFKVDAAYFLCRCGQSKSKPFCDGTHLEIGFVGTETATATPTTEKRATYPGSKNIVIRTDMELCTEAGFCANRMTSIAEMAYRTEDTQVRAMAIAMIEHCPSGSLTYALTEQGEDIEVDLPQQIAVVTDVLTEGNIEGPLWVTGRIPILRADGTLLEVRNRVTLCNCGRSQNKPFCDGMHRSDPVFLEKK